ncbi:MAG TPA: trehalose-phosphatase [Candidatus Binataceae bacterium]
MPSNLRPSPPDNGHPQPLPPDLLPDLARDQRLLLLLDYDGTLSEIAANPADARPLEGIKEVLAKLASFSDRLALAIVSGRTIDDVLHFVGTTGGFFYAGNHGLELMLPDGTRRISPDPHSFAADLDRVRDWIRHNVPDNRGFIAEDKRLSITINYRSAHASDAVSVRDAFEAFIARQAPRLRVLHGKAIVEAIPRGADKGAAVRKISEIVNNLFTPIYFGDDDTDEYAFRELAGRGITVLVGEARESAAQFRVVEPGEVLFNLRKVAKALSQRPQGVRE